MNNFVFSAVISLSILFISGNSLLAQESRLKLYRSLELKINYDQTYNLNTNQIVKKFKLRPIQRLELFKSQDLPSKKRGVCKIEIEIYQPLEFMSAPEIAEEIKKTGAELANIIIVCELMQKTKGFGSEHGFIGLGSHFEEINDETLKYHLTLIPKLFCIKNSTFLELQEYKPGMYGEGAYFVAVRKIE